MKKFYNKYVCISGYYHGDLAKGICKTYFVQEIKFLTLEELNIAKSQPFDSDYYNFHTRKRT